MAKLYAKYVQMGIISIKNVPEEYIEKVNYYLKIMEKNDKDLKIH